MMIVKRICLLALVLSFGLAGTAQAKQYALASGSGAQLHIGNGLALPVQPAATVVNGAFPPLLIERKAGQQVSGTTVMTTNQVFTVPANVLHKSAAQTTVGVFFSNPTLYAVATNLNYDWPTAPAVFSENGRGGPAVQTLTGGAANQIIRYSPRIVGKRFGGAAAFALSPGTPSGFQPGAPITIFAIAAPGPGNPPCTHPQFGGTNGLCFAALINALPTGVAGVGLPAGQTIMTPGGIGGLPPNPGRVNGQFGGVLTPTANQKPLGTVVQAALTTVPNNGATNMATSFGFPFTTGVITLSAGQATGAPELFVISGNDLRTTGGAGTIQMVAGALSLRPLSGNNANRGWLRLVLAEIPVPAVPTMSPLAMGIAVILLLALPAYYFSVRSSDQAI